MSATTAKPAPRRRAERAPTTKRVLTHFVLIIYSAFAVGPIIITLFASLKSEPSFFSSPASFPTHFFFSNYSQAWAQGDLLVAFGNSVLVTVVSVLVSGITGAMAAYAVVRLKAGRAGIIHGYFLSGFVVPVEITEAAYLDGCSHFRTFWSIDLPLVRPAIATVAILNGVFVWNDFLLPLVLETKSDLYTLPVAIESFFGTYSTSYGLVFAAVILASAPMILLYIGLNRLFVEGITAGAVK